VVHASHAKEPGSPNRSVSSAPHSCPLFLPAFPHRLQAALLLPFPAGLQRDTGMLQACPCPGEPGPGVGRMELWGAAPRCQRGAGRWRCVPPEGMCEGPVGQAECHWLSFAFALEASCPARGSSSRLGLLSSPALCEGRATAPPRSPACSQPFGVHTAANGRPGPSPGAGTTRLSDPVASRFQLQACFPQELQPFAKQSQLPGHKRLKFTGI